MRRQLQQHITRSRMRRGNDELTLAGLIARSGSELKPVIVLLGCSPRCERLQLEKAGTRGKKQET
jgi:hypothetical protein